jgi:DNA-binding transcriptional LysR family regulator
MESNEVDFALVSVLPKKLKVNSVELMKNQLYLVGGSQLELEHVPTQKELFTKLPLIFREEGSATRNAMEQFTSKNSFQIRKKIELTSNEAVKQAVQAGLGFSIMPLIGIKNELKQRELQIIPVKGLPISTTWQVIWLSSKKLSPAATAYVEYLKINKERVIDSHFSWIKDYE